MPTELKNIEDLNRYIAPFIISVVYGGKKIAPVTEAQVNDKNFVALEKDKVIKTMTYRWMEEKVRTYFTKDEAAPFLKRLTAADAADDENWIKAKIKRGEAVYLFDGLEVPPEFLDDLQSKLKDINTYLYSCAAMHLDKALEQNKPVRLSVLKENPKHETFTLTLDEALKWQKLVAERKQKERQKEALKEGTKFIMDLGDGFKAVELLTSEALDLESEYLGHCVGEGGYDRSVKEGKTNIYSIRDKSDLPHATLQVDQEYMDRDQAWQGIVIQCRGKADKAVVDRYKPYVQKFVLAQNFIPFKDMKSMGFCRDINGNLHDIHNIPAGTVFSDLDVSDIDFAEFPDFSHITVTGSFNCSGCASFNSLKKLPKGIKELNCSCCSSLTSLEDLPEGLEILDCTGCNSLTSLKGIKEGLKTLRCIACNSLTDLEGCPESLETIFCTGSTSLTSFKGLKEGVKEVHCRHCSALASFEYCPQSVEKLIANDCTSVTSLKGLKEGLKELVCSNCTSLLTLEGCPESVDNLDCSGCVSLTSLKGAPKEVKWFDCRGCTALTSLEGCPKGMTVFDCSRCTSLPSLKGLPEGIKELTCRYCNSLTSLEGVPESVEILDCALCASLTSLKGCPKGLKEIVLSYNLALTSLEGLPKGIEAVYCEGCDNLKSIPDYIPDEIIFGMDKKKIAACKANWRAEQATKASPKAKRTAGEKAGEKAGKKAGEKPKTKATQKAKLKPKADNLSRLLTDDFQNSR